MRYLFVLFFISSINNGISAQSVRDTSVRFATINIRVDMKKDSANYWGNRKEQMRDFVREQALDIACMQEVSTNQMRYLVRALTEYDCVGDSPKVVTGEEYLPIFYKRTEYECLESGTFWLSETPDSAGSKGWDGKHTRRATWAQLKSPQNGRIFCVVNTHLDHVGKIARLEGMKLIKKQMKDIAAEMPVLLCGDMNFNAISASYYSALNDEFLMYNAYQIAKDRKGVNYSYHAFGKALPEEKRSMIDYIFVTNQVDVEEINIPKEEEKDGVYLTDHCPVVVNICFLK